MPKRRYTLTLKGAAAVGDDDYAVPLGDNLAIPSSSDIRNMIDVRGVINDELVVSLAPIDEIVAVYIDRVTRRPD